MRCFQCFDFNEIRLDINFNHTTTFKISGRRNGFHHTTTTQRRGAVCMKRVPTGYCLLKFFAFMAWPPALQVSVSAELRTMFSPDAAQGTTWALCCLTPQLFSLGIIAALFCSGRAQRIRRATISGPVLFDILMHVKPLQYQAGLRGIQQNHRRAHTRGYSFCCQPPGRLHQSVSWRYPSVPP